MIDSACFDHAICIVGVAGFPYFFVVVESGHLLLAYLMSFRLVRIPAKQHAILFVFLEGWTPLWHLFVNVLWDG